MFPSVAVIRDEALQDRHCGGLVLSVSVLEGACDRGNISKRRLFGQKAPDLKVGVDSHFQVAEEFQDESLAVEYRAVALLGLHERGLEFSGCCDSQPFEGTLGDANQLAGRARQTTRLANGIEKNFQDGLIRERVRKDVFRAVRLTDANPRVVVVRRLRSAGGLFEKRHGIRVARAFT